MSPRNASTAAGAALRRSASLLLKLPALAAQLAVLTTAAEQKEGILYSLTPQYKDKYLVPVERHVSELGRKAEEFKKLLQGSRAASSLGVAAASAWGRRGTGGERGGASGPPRRGRRRRRRSRAGPTARLRRRRAARRLAAPAPAGPRPAAQS
ncbi:hypothetical protein ACJJTC_012442 [Scirpophaga incertulas]